MRTPLGLCTPRQGAFTERGPSVQHGVGFTYKNRLTREDAIITLLLKALRKGLVRVRSSEAAFGERAPSCSRKRSETNLQGWQRVAGGRGERPPGNRIGWSSTPEGCQKLGNRTAATAGSIRHPCRGAGLHSRAPFPGGRPATSGYPLATLRVDQARMPKLEAEGVRGFVAEGATEATGLQASHVGRAHQGRRRPAGATGVSAKVMALRPSAAGNLHPAKPGSALLATEQGLLVEEAGSGIFSK